MVAILIAILELIAILIAVFITMYCVLPLLDIQKTAEVNCCKHLYKIDGQKHFLLFPRSEQVFLTISIFSKATLDEDLWRGSNLHLSPEAILAILVHFIF